jgi:hypothetical protein
MFFSKARKWKKVGDAVLAEVQPLVMLAERQAGKKICALRDDDYILGFITGLSAITAKRDGENLTQEDSGTILFLVLDQIYGKDVIDRKRLGDLLNGIPQPNPLFIKGFECAGKIQVLLYGRHKLYDDPDYKQALDAVRSGAGHTLSLAAPESTEDSNVAALLMNQYFLQPVLQKLGGRTEGVSDNAGVPRQE